MRSEITIKLQEALMAVFALLCFAVITVIMFITVGIATVMEAGADALDAATLKLNQSRRKFKA